MGRSEGTLRNPTLTFGTPLMIHFHIVNLIELSDDLIYRQVILCKAGYTVVLLARGWTDAEDIVVNAAR